MAREQIFHTHQLENGLTIIGERMEAVTSGAFSILVPLGAATDPDDQRGAAAILSEMFQKGAGDWDARRLSAELDGLGLQRGHSAGSEVSMFSGALLGENLSSAIEIYSRMLLEPQLPEAELESVRALALQELAALEDHPASKAMVELSARFYPEPFGRSQLGTRAGLEAVTGASLREYYRRAFVPKGAIIAVAGDFDWEEVRDTIERGFGSWTGAREPLAPPPHARENASHHVAQDTAQVQIALAFPSVSYDHPDYYAIKVACGVLSGGMCGRLFVEVREKRGLVYRVGATHSGAKGRGAVFAYAGTTPDNAEETLAVMLCELRGLAAGASEEELARAKADLKSRLVMQAEISSARSSAIVNDWWNLGRLRSVEEMKQGVDAVTSEAMVAALERHPFSPATLVALGPKALELPK